MIFVRAIIGGLIAVLIAWTAIVIIDSRLVHGRHPGQLTAVAGGWDYLLQLPQVVLMLAVAFGTGMYVVARWSVHR